MIKVSENVEMGLFYAFMGTFAACVLLVVIIRELPTRSSLANVLEIIAFTMFALAILFIILFMVSKSPRTHTEDKVVVVIKTLGLGAFH